MAVKCPADELSKFMGDSKHASTDRRRDIWLWFYLPANAAELNPTLCGGSSMRDELARRLKQHYFSASDIRKAQDTHLVNEKNLKWITDDKRQLQWLEPHIVNFTNYPNQPDLTNLSKRELLIARVDVLDVSLERKCSELLLLKNEWNKWTEEDGIYDWFKDKKEGEQRLACARHWIEKQPIEWRGFQKASNLSTLEDLIIFFDHKCGNWFERKAAISEIRKRWNKKNFDAKNKHKRQINVMLTTDAIGQLDQLCRESNSSRAKIIEELIRGHKQTAKQPL